ncbi:hypothetical protein GCM10007036_30630 [Alsobacter metallidurans]|uniref:Response regulatory domain-containing protein n=1 Tax=Alsobacter metallidurans TaxID=340221 RepID=A0A917MI42_9HYPH|nr:hypothetical protein GCM10007036_30630 [Alsobacter metallidurans]
MKGTLFTVQKALPLLKDGGTVILTGSTACAEGTPAFTEALGELGYRVIEADGAAAALRQLEAHPETVLMFTDIVMPGMNGAKLAEEALRRKPELKILFTTGYTRNAVVHNGVLDSGVQLPGKPYSLDDLAAKVCAILDGAG